MRPIGRLASNPYETTPTGEGPIRFTHDHLTAATSVRAPTHGSTSDCPAH
jgi:hypothetical protein